MHGVDVTGLDLVAVCVPDNSGRLIGKRLPTSAWSNIQKAGLSMPNYHLVTGIENRPLNGLAVTGLHTGFPNGTLRPVIETFCSPSWEPGTGLVLCDVFAADGTPVLEAPRSVLKAQVERLRALGLHARMASELEFYLFRDSFMEVQAAGYTAAPVAYHQHADNDILLAGLESPMMKSIISAMDALGIELEAWQGEGGLGQHEINFKPAEPLTMADRHVIYKHGTKAIAHQRGRAITFMAKPWTDRAGSSCHVHLSVSDEAGDSVLVGPDGQMTPRGKGFLAGLLRYSPELAVLHSPYANSYRRLQPGSWAPCNATWGFDNRTVMVRVLGREKSFRFEYRLPGADANPYHSFAAIIAAGLRGMEEGLELPAPTTGDAYAGGAGSLPGDLTEAVEKFEQSKIAREAFGPQVRDHLASLARLELSATRRAVTDWEVQRGFENA
jgi:glutamine synthetase